MRSRGQASVEAFVATVFLVATLLIVLYSTFTMSSQSLPVLQNAWQKIECARLDFAISQIEGTVQNASAELEFADDFNILGEYISFGAEYCYHNGLKLQKTISKGRVRVSKIDGILDIENL